MKKLLFVVGSVVVVVAVFAVAAAKYRQGRAARLDFMAQERASTFVRPHSPARGADTAKVYLVEFTDPACETCASFAPIVESLLERHAGKVRLVVRYAPFHQGSQDLVRVLEAARRQGKFWETLHLLYQTQDVWSAGHRVYAGHAWPLLPQLGLDMDRLRADVDDPAVAAVIEQDLADARALGVDKTPGFFVNGKPLEPFGVAPLAALVAAEVRARYPG